MLFRFLIFRLAVPGLLAVTASLTVAQSLRPAAEYRSLLNMRFSETNGEFVVEDLQIVFPPKGDEPVTLTVNRASGEEVLRVPLHFEPNASFPLFGRLVPSPESGAIRLGQSGDFVLTITVAERLVTRLPFTLKGEADGDPYDPPKKFVREGPWRDLAYFSIPSDERGGKIEFNWWMSRRELPKGMTNPRVSIHLMRDSREIAASRDLGPIDDLDWQFFKSALVQNKKSSPALLTLEDLVKRDGDYLLIVEASGVPIKSFRLQVKYGRLQRLDQNRLDFEPHADFISPRLIETSAGSPQQLMQDIYWVRRSAVIANFTQQWAKR